MTDQPGGYNPPRNESTPETVKQEAADVARTAAERGGQVGGTAGEQAKRVASETARQARDLVSEGRTQLVEQAKQGQRKAADSLHTLADQLHDMAEKTDGDGMAPEVVRQAADRTRTLASWLDGREPGTLLEDVRTFARRRPGVFLAGAAVAGVLVGRLTRGAVAAASDDSGDSGGSNGKHAQPTQATRPPVAGDRYPGSATGQPYDAPPTTPSYSVPPPPPPPVLGQPSPGTPMPGQPLPGNPTGTPSYSVPPNTPGQYPGPVTR